MILEYHRPKSVESALKLLKRDAPTTMPLGGGTYLNSPMSETVAVVDLQELGLDEIEKEGNTLRIGARVTLQTLVEREDIPLALQAAIRKEAGINLRRTATLAGKVVTADGRSALATALLALDATLHIARHGEKSQTLKIGELLVERSMKGSATRGLRGGLITHLNLPVPGAVRLAYQDVARTPADRPLVCAAAAIWESGRTRVTLGGAGNAPILVLDGPQIEAAESVQRAAQAAYSQTGDEWASAAYRQHAAGILARRCFADLINGQPE